ncbi:MAG: hypothetical protein GF353_29585 [Candidatus Lokiarchaeota archaeon]|nr:hypothetical protein [Candidatus Lokiarchaeota archaeon]
MGHWRLGLPHMTRKWLEVVAILSNGAAVEDVAAATMRASQSGLKKAPQDPTLIYTFWLLTQIPKAARSENFSEELRKLNLDVSNNPTLMEIVAAFNDSIGIYSQHNRVRSDIGAMAQLAATEIMSEVVGKKLPTLFYPEPGDVQSAFKSFSETKHFSSLGRTFFTRFTERYLKYYLSRELSNHVGPTKAFKNIDDHSDFNDAFHLHCHETSRIVQEFVGEWYSKQTYQGGIDEKKSQNFLSKALGKIRKELERRGQAHG